MLAFAIGLGASAQEFAPGIPLPDHGTVWLLDSATDAHNLVQLKYVAAKLNSHRGANFGRQMAWPITNKVKQTVEIPGTAAAVRISSASAPVLLVRDIMHDDDAATPDAGPGWKPAIIHLKAEKGVRLVNTLSFTMITGHPSRETNSIDFSSESIKGTPWVRIVFTRPLEPGEYAFTWIPDATNGFASVVYDFGVGPAADEKK